MFQWKRYWTNIITKHIPPDELQSPAECFNQFLMMTTWAICSVQSKLDHKLSDQSSWTRTCVLQKTFFADHLKSQFADLTLWSSGSFLLSHFLVWCIRQAELNIGKTKLLYSRKFYSSVTATIVTAASDKNVMWGTFLT